MLKCGLLTSSDLLLHNTDCGWTFHSLNGSYRYCVIPKTLCSQSPFVLIRNFMAYLKLIVLTQPCVRLHLVQWSPIKIITRYQIPDELQFRQRCQHRDFEWGTLLCYQIEDYWQQLHANNFVSSKNTAAGSAESFYCWSDWFKKSCFLEK